MHKTRPRVETTARCACGAVTIAVDGPVRWMFMCSCDECQKMTGTGHSTVALFRASDVTVTGEVRAFSRPADTGATFTGHFCPVCGTPLFGRTSRAEDAILLLAGFFGAGAAEWYAPEELIFARSHREWDVVAEHLPRSETYRNREEF